MPVAGMTSEALIHGQPHQPNLCPLVFKKLFLEQVSHPYLKAS